ncbi:MAG: DUF4166 domain-containing protein [Stappiaceae bacterium]
MKKRVLLIGGTGQFGRRLAHHLATNPQISLTIAGRNQHKIDALVAQLNSKTSAADIDGLVLDHHKDLDGTLATLAPWLVVDTSGPFQNADYYVAKASLEAGAHIIDIADARSYLMGYTDALDALACEKGLCALAGASSTPALSAAVVADLTREWQRIDTIDLAITPAGRSAVGRAAIEAALSYAGHSIPGWEAGGPAEVRGWADGQSIVMPGLGKRRVARVETADADYLGNKFQVRSRIAFYAGLESILEQRGMETLAYCCKNGWIDNLTAFAAPLQAARQMTRLTTSESGGMLVRIGGIDKSGTFCRAEWSLLAQNGDGPSVPVLPAAAAISKLLKQPVDPGARIADDCLSLAEIETEMAPYAIATDTKIQCTNEAPFDRALGTATFEQMPPVLQTLHRADSPPVWQGKAHIDRGTSLPARLGAWLIGLPASGRDVPVTVTLDRDPSGQTEKLTRNFSGKRFFSHMQLGPNREVIEGFGLLRFAIGVTADEEGTKMPVTQWWFAGIPLPRFLLPRSDTREFEDAEGRFNFDVRISLPLFGLLVHYRGWLVPLQSGPVASTKNIAVHKRTSVN